MIKQSLTVFGILCVFVLGVSVSFWINPDYVLSDRKLVLKPGLAFADGSEYVGEVNAAGQPEGEGVLAFADGSSYTGQFHRGVMQGYGVLEAANGSRYEGHFHQGNLEGLGRMDFNDTEYYEGEFKKSQPNGMGTWVVEGQYVYEGEVHSGRIEGKGRFTFSDGAVYEGEVADQQMNGIGKYTYGDEIYEGMFVDSNFIGKGVYIDEYGNRFEGDFVDWQPHGQVLLTNDQGVEIEGQFEFGAPHGKASFRSMSGETYEGEYEQGRYHGVGELVTPSGDRYSGDFRAGRFHGDGEVTYARPVDGQQGYKGSWRYGKLTSSDAFPVFSGEMIAEHGLANQHVQLQDALAKVQPNDSGSPKAYFLGIAGDGTQEVFRREITLAHTLLNERFDFGDNAVLLVNSRRDIDHHPYATAASIESAIADIANKMDTQTDVLVIFATSHGSSDHELVLKHSGLKIADYPANRLAKALETAGVQNKVVMISACYSGGFIRHLADDDSLILTAAADDRTSFGCDDNQPLTFFGNALLKNGLGQSGSESLSLPEIFDTAKQRIQIWEAALDLTPSNPQIHVGKHILQRLNALSDQPLISETDAPQP